MNKKKNFIIISAGRSDYYRYLPIIKELDNSKKVKIYIYLTQYYNNKVFGNLKKEIKKNFQLLKNNSDKTFYGDRPKDIAGNFLIDANILYNHIRKISPDFIIIMGDRYEMMLGPLISLPYNIPLIHFYGGAVTEGATDELSRHALTKMSHFHFVLVDKYRKRLLQLGEESWRVKTTGMLSLKDIENVKKNNLKKLITKYQFDFSTPFILVTFHPVTIELKDLKKQIFSIIKAIKLSKINAVITYPNSDANFNLIINNFKKKLNQKKKYIFIKNLGEENYYTLMKNAKFMLGNSSSGIVESASFNLPVINIGSRQEGKLKPKNIINSDYSVTGIVNAIKKCKKKSFLQKIKKLKNPYKPKINAHKIAKIILNLKANDKLLRKKFIDIK